MKKSFFLLFALFGFALSSCDYLNGFLSSLAGDFFPASSPSSASSSSSSLEESSEIEISGSSLSYVEGEMASVSIHFLELGNQYTGDCIYIKAGENDILIDAGSRKGSAATIAAYLQDGTRGGDYVSDGKLEYVIATHAHQDHIAGFVGNQKGETRDGIMYQFKVDNLIDFSYYDTGSKVFDNTKVTYEESDGLTQIYEDYLDARNFLIASGTNWKTAGQLFEEGTTVFPLGPGVELDLLYNFFYDHTSADVKELEPGFSKSGFSNQNDCSVSVLLRQGSRSFLFTGDSEEYAEHSLVKYNDLPEVDLFKCGHHGSYTASGEELLSAIKPKSVVACCCAGNDEYASDPKHSFPAQEAIDRIAEYTDDFYVTTLGSWDDGSHYESMNGNVVFAYDRAGVLTKSFSHNDLKLKDTAWFKENRECPDPWKEETA